jgi:hypothetical protein
MHVIIDNQRLWLALESHVAAAAGAVCWLGITFLVLALLIALRCAFGGRGNAARRRILPAASEFMGFGHAVERSPKLVAQSGEVRERPRLARRPPASANGVMAACAVAMQTQSTSGVAE